MSNIQHTKYRHQYKEIYSRLFDFKPVLRCNPIRHIQFKHERVIYKCDQCDYNTKLKSNIWRHKKNIHEQGKHEFKFWNRCDQCHFKLQVRNFLLITQKII